MNFILNQLIIISNFFIYLKLKYMIKINFKKLYYNARVKCHGYVILLFFPIYYLFQINL